MKRSEMARGRGFKPRTKRMKQRSDKMAKFYRTEYVPATKAAAEELCVIQIPGVCTGRAQSLHERRTRARSGGVIAAFREPGNAVSACNQCNQWCSEHPIEAGPWLLKAMPMEEATS